MKTKFFTLMMSMALFTNAMTQNVLFDIDFSSAEWKTAFGTALSTDLSTLNVDAIFNVTVGVKPTVTVNGNSFIFDNFAVYRAPAPFTQGWGGANIFEYGIRLKSGAAQIFFMEFPEVSSAGMITLYVAAGQNATSFGLECKADANGDPDLNGSFLATSGTTNMPNLGTNPGQLTYWNVPSGTDGYDDGNATVGDLKLTYDISINEPVKLRLWRTGYGTFMHIYRIVLEDYVASAVSSFNKKMNLSVSGKTLLLPEVANAKLSVYDLAGKPVLNTAVTSDKVTLNVNSGVYIVKLVSEQGELTQKIVIR
ncbi:MAG: T9SS type A sorting domain-containing protein [Prevotella sp.]|jgi:hypothetical protein|nr:T9SS type A sorting domain-containing protein [Prevotella sp.]